MHRIMIVDDEPLVLEQLHLLIDHSDRGMQIVCDCRYGAEALESVSLCSPDILITDVCMPDMNGLELINKMMGQAVKPMAYIILSGYRQFEYAQTAMELNVTEYLLKPIFEEELNVALEKSSNRLEELRRREDFRIEPEERDREILSVEQFYGKSGISKEDIFYQPVTCPDVLEKILLLLPQQALECADLFLQMCGRKRVEPRRVRNSILNLLCDAGRDEELTNIFILGEWMERMGQCDTLPKLRNNLGEWIKMCCMELQNRRVENSRGIIVQLKKYVDEHYMENFTLTQLAGQLHANPVYLGQGFRKAYGKHFHSYITSLRMEKSKKLLEESAIPIQEIAKEVGYENYCVFKSNFISTTGMPPALYRKNTGALHGEKILQ